MSTLSPAKRFLLGSLIILVAGMSVIGFWVTRQIEDGIVHRSASTTAVYVDSLIASSVQGIETTGSLLPEQEERLTWLMTDTPLGQQVAVFRIWDLAGSVVYSSVPVPDVADQEMDTHYMEAARGEVSAHLGDIEGEPVADETLPEGPFLEIYSPVRRSGTDEVIAIAEFYYGAEDLRDDLAEARRNSWLIVAGITGIIYLLLAAFVQRTSNTIVRQQSALAEQVERLQELLARNEELTARVRTAAKRTTALNERFLRRVSAELHDGPAQDMSVALLRLDHVQERAQSPDVTDLAPELDPDLAEIKGSMTRALNDIRATSAGLILPHLGNLDLVGTVEHAVRTHTLRTGSAVTVDTEPVSEPVDLPVKIAVYRVVQEALANGWRHAAGAGQHVALSRTDGTIRLVVSDTGPGFDAALSADADHLGLTGMRERVESLGGTFQIDSRPGAGTRIVANLPLVADGDRYE